MKPHRFWVPVLPFLFLLVLEGYELLRQGLLRFEWKGEWFGFTVLAIFLAGFNLWSWTEVRRYTSGYSEGMERTSVALGKWLAKEASSNDWVALGDVGALPYYSGLRVIDLYGLVNPEIARLPGPAVYSEGIDTAEIVKMKPRYIVLESRSEVAFEGLKPVERKMALEPDFQREYVLIHKARFSPSEVTWLFERRVEP